MAPSGCLARSRAGSLAFGLGLALGAAGLPAQTFIVDAQNGAGTNFTDIQAAVTAVPSGATLHVRPGGYSGFSIANKSLTVIGQPSATGAFPNINVNLLLPGVFVGPLAANQSVRISGFAVGPAAASPSAIQFNVSGCAGPVLIEDMVWTFQIPFLMSVTNSANVHAVRLSLSSFIPGGSTPSNPPVVVQNSSVEFFRLATQGYRTTSSFVAATAAMRIAQQSRVVLAQSNISGGVALVANAVPGPGVVVDGSTLHAFGNSSVSATAIQGGGSVATGGPGLVLQQGSFARVRGPGLAGGFGLTAGQAFTRDGSSTIDHDPADVPPSAFLAGAVQAGNTVRYTLQAQPGSLSALLFGFDAQFTMPPLLSLGAFGVLPIVSVATGIVPANGRVELASVVPLAWQTDTIFLAQYVVLDPGNNEIAASNVFTVTSR
jgi:hypothetical protein